VVLLAWLVPGGGHFLLKRPARGAILGASVALVFLLGLMMRRHPVPARGRRLAHMVIYYGGFIGDLLAGILYFLTVWLGYSQPTCRPRH